MVIDKCALVYCDEMFIPIPNDVDAQKAFDGAFVIDFNVFCQLVMSM
jgi:hypothetical protein